MTLTFDLLTHFFLDPWSGPLMLGSLVFKTSCSEVWQQTNKRTNGQLTNIQLRLLNNVAL